MSCRFVQPLYICTQFVTVVGITAAVVKLVHPINIQFVLITPSDIVGRTLKEDGKYTISFKSNEVVFGGSRLKLTVNEIPSEYSEICKLYDDNEAVEPKKFTEKVEEIKPTVEETEPTTSTIDEPSFEDEKPRTRKRRGE